MAVIGMRARRRAALALISAALVAAGCSSTTDGSPVASGDRSNVPSGSNKPDFPTAPVPSASSGPTRGPTSGPGTDRLGQGCPTGHDFCDAFEDSGSGWQVANEENFFSGYDSYAGGTYRVGERGTKTYVSYAPVELFTIASDSSVQVDVDAMLAPQSPESAAFGISCWGHKNQAGGTGAFLFFVYKDAARIVLWTDTGSSERLADATLPPLADGPHHLTAQCLQTVPKGERFVHAVMSLKIDGKPAVSVSYAKSLKNHEWSVGQQVGLLAAGKGADVFYDNFAITGMCDGDLC